MTEKTKDRLVELGVVALINTIVFILIKYFILPETGMLMKINGEWETSKHVFPYTSDLSFSEWPLVIQQGFLLFMFGTLLTVFIIYPILDLIFWFIVDGIRRLFQ